MHPLLYVLACLALPWAWSAVVAAVLSRLDRRERGITRDKLPTDYSI